MTEINQNIMKGFPLKEIVQREPFFMEEPYMRLKSIWTPIIIKISLC